MTMQGRPHLNKVEKQNYSIPENNLINSFCFVKRASKWPKIEWYFNLVLVTSQRNTRHVLDALAINQKWHNCSGYHATVLSVCTYSIITNLRILMDITIICIKYSQNANKYQAILNFNTTAYITVWHFSFLTAQNVIHIGYVILEIYLLMQIQTWPEMIILTIFRI